MLLTELIQTLRVDFLDDVAEPYLWSDPELVSKIIEAEKEACERANLIIDDSTPEICHIAVQQGVMGYTLDDRVLLVRRASFGTSSTSTYPLTQTTKARADETHPGWNNHTGTPGVYICEENGSIIIAPAAAGTTGTDGIVSTAGTAGTAFLQVSRYPLNRMTLNSTAGTGTAGKGITYPEIPPSYHYKMLHWAAHLAFLKNDSETFNAAKADKHAGLFAQYFGLPIDAATKQFMRSNNLNSPRMRPREFGS
ncbi:MAG: hypothetical protein LLG40_13255 [Deltaproteobacteria bacterium]|nr:hypothetical protein [Deltaproteobacteria bacterium]